MAKITPPVFDEEKVVVGFDHSSYNIKFYVFFSEADTTDLSAEEFDKIKEKYENTNRACFAQFLSMCKIFLSKYKKFPNRVRYFCERKKHKNDRLHLSTEEIRRWTILCKKNKLMPSNIGKNFIENGYFDIRIDHLSKEMAYLYLSTARYIQDEPFFVRAIIHMVDDNKMGFFTSFAVATAFCTTNTGHHLVPESRIYSVMQ